MVGPGARVGRRQRGVGRGAVKLARTTGDRTERVSQAGQGQAQAGDKQRTGGSVAERPIDRRTNEQLHEQTNQETNSGVRRQK